MSARSVSQMADTFHSASLWLEIAPVYGYLIANAFHSFLHAEAALCRLVTGADLIII